MLPSRETLGRRAAAPTATDVLRPALGLLSVRAA